MHLFAASWPHMDILHETILDMGYRIFIYTDIDIFRETIEKQQKRPNCIFANAFQIASTLSIQRKRANRVNIKQKRKECHWKDRFILDFVYFRLLQGERITYSTYVIYIYVYTHLYTYIFIYICIHICIHICEFICIYIYI